MSTTRENEKLKTGAKNLDGRAQLKELQTHGRI
jgi:hypothetical protein